MLRLLHQPVDNATKKVVDIVGCVAIHNLQLKSIFWQRRTLQGAVGAGSPTNFRVQTG